jgi:radical SAM protein with 4Fe4S-binding SPASM domain
MCDYWSRKKENEMSKEEWLSCLKEMKKWHRNAHVQFSGGEPLIRKDAIEIFEYCDRINLSYGVTTNLSALPGNLPERLVKAQPFNINVSLDGIEPDTHDYSRGIKGTFTKVMNNIDNILGEMRKQNRQLRVIIKTTVMKKNVDQLEGIVRFVKEKGLTGVNFQPIFKWSGTSSEEMWVTDLDQIREVSNKLVDMKKKGFPILSSERDLLSWEGYFKDELLTENKRGKCVVGIKNYDILPDGDVYLCRTINSMIGNLTESKPSEIWNSRAAKHERDRIIKCRKLCLATCQTQRKMKDLLAAFIRMSQSN